jgi:hypothetical protein
MQNATSKVYSEISERFPEIRSRFSEGDEELPYLLMGYLADWLKELRKEALTPEIINRVIMFTRWCEEQPRGKDAGDDVLTIFTVGFFEALFDSETTRAILPKITTRDDIVTNADYLRAWVGGENYDKALKLYAPKA